MGGYAWVTLATNNSYSLGALVLAHSLKKSNTAHKLVVLITPAVSQSMREQLQTVFDVVKVVDVLDSKDEAHLALMKRPDLGITFTKIHCWRLVEFDKCVFLDADTLVVRNCDELFEREEFSAAPDVSWPDCFNSGVFVYRPSIETFNKLLQFAVENRSFDGGDQGLLNQFFSDWATEDIKKHLPFVYNLTSVAAYSYIPAFKHYGAETRIVHFIGTGKPWLQQLDATTRTVTPTSGSEHLAPLLQQWWDLFCEKVHPNLDKNLDININGMSQPPVEACSNSLPLALTDDLPCLIEPCTPYREKDDFRQSNLPYQPFDVKGSSGELLNIEFLLASVVSPVPETNPDEQQGQFESEREEVTDQDKINEKIEKTEKLENNEKFEKTENNEKFGKSENIVEETRTEPENAVEKSQEEEPPPTPKDPFDFHTFFPDEACISNYLEQNVAAYHPFSSPETKNESNENSPSLPRFLTIPEDDRRQSGNVEICKPDETHHEHHVFEHKEPQPTQDHGHYEQKAHECKKEPSPPKEEPEKRELIKSKSLPYIPCDFSPQQPSLPQSIWKSQPDVTVDPNRKYSMPKLKPILPKQNSFSKSVPSAMPKITLYTEFFMSSDYKDPVDLPKDKVGFVQTHLHDYSKLRRAKSYADISAKFGPLPYPSSPETEKPIVRSQIPLRHKDNELYDLTQCKRQMGNKPKPKDIDRKVNKVCPLPALKPIVPEKDKKSTLIKKRKSKALSPGDGGREKMAKKEHRGRRDRKREIKTTPRNVSTNETENSLDAILEKLRGFTKNYQHFFGKVPDFQTKAVTCRNASVQNGECKSSEEYDSVRTLAFKNTKETQTLKSETSEFRQFRNYVQNQRETSQQGLLSIQKILAEPLKNATMEKSETTKEVSSNRSYSVSHTVEDRKSNSENSETVIEESTPIEQTKSQTTDSESSHGSISEKHEENNSDVQTKSLNGHVESEHSKVLSQNETNLTEEKEKCLKEVTNTQTVHLKERINQIQKIEEHAVEEGDKGGNNAPINNATEEVDTTNSKVENNTETTKKRNADVKCGKTMVPSPIENGIKVSGPAEQKNKHLAQILCVPDFETPRSSRVTVPPGKVTEAAEEEPKTAMTNRNLKTQTEFKTPDTTSVNLTHKVSENSPDETVTTENVCLEDSKLSGIAGAIAQLSLDAGTQESPNSTAASAAHQEYLRRQNWETGNMDYMGRDSFDNIWSKICQTIESKELEETAAGVSKAEESTGAKESTESPVSLSSILDKCPEYIDTLPESSTVNPMEDNDIIFAKLENKVSPLTNIWEEEGGSGGLSSGNIKLSDILQAGAPPFSAAPTGVNIKSPPAPAEAKPASQTLPMADIKSQSQAAPPAPPAESKPQVPPTPTEMRSQGPATPETKPQVPLAPTAEAKPQAPVTSATESKPQVPPTLTPETKLQAPATTTIEIMPQTPATPTTDMKSQAPAATPTETKPQIPATPTAETKPQIPATPTSEAKPQIPATPTSETKPQIPATPTSETKPQVPATPTAEAKPQVPRTPTSEAKPQVPETPTSEAKPQVPATPTSETKPQVPATPTAETKPQVPGTPTAETKPQIPATPTSEAKPQVPGTPTSEVKPQVPATPTAETKPQVPAQVTAKPVLDAKSQVPVTPTTEAKPQVSAAPDPEMKPQIPPATLEPSSAPGIEPKPSSTVPLTPESKSDKPECKTVAICQPPINYQTAPKAEEKLPEQCKTVALPSPPIFPPGEKDKKPQVQLEPIPLPPPDSAPAPEQKSEGQDKGKQKKGVFTKILEMVGVGPKEKTESEISKSVFYDVGKSKGEGVEEKVEEGVEVLKSEEQGKPEEIKGEVKSEKVEEGEKKEEPKTEETEVKPQTIAKPARNASPKEEKPKSGKGGKKSPSPKQTPAPAPPPASTDLPSTESAPLKVEDTAPAVQEKVQSEIEEIIGKAKTEVESLLQERRSADKETGEDGDLINAMKLMVGATDKPEEKEGENVEELKVTTEEERKRHKGEAVSSKLSDQILKAIPPPRRKAISEAATTTSTPPAATASTSAIPKSGEQQKPGEGKGKSGKPSSIPVPPPRNKGKPTPPPPPKSKGKK